MFGRMFGAIILCVMSVFASIVYADNTKIERYVFAISANNGGSTRPMLRYAESDAKSFVNVMHEMGGVPKSNQFFVREPSVSEIKKQLSVLDGVLKKNKGQNARQEVLVYYSGHADEKGIHLGNENFAWSELRANIDNLNADVKIAVIDACGSGAITRSKGGVAVPAFMVDASSDMKGYAFITSSTQDESSQESDQLKGSFFTHSLVSGLRGAGDLSGDGKVTLSESYQFAFNETLQKTQNTMGGAQHPSRDMSLAGTGDIVMTDLRSTSAGVAFEKSLEGRLFIRDERGELVAELYKKSDREMELGLPAGKYNIQLEKPAMQFVADVTIANGKRENVSEANFKQMERVATVSRGEIGGNGENERIDSLDRNGRFRTTFNLVDISHEPRKGLMLGLFLAKSNDVMLGSQVSLIGNVAREEMHGLQVSPIFNIAKSNYEGLQLSSTFNFAHELEGVQVGSVNVVRNVSRNAVQVGAVNVAGFTPIQVGAINIAKESRVQVSAINVAKKIDAAQVSAINIAGNAKGRQWGVINIVGHAEKTPIGLLNFVGNGVWSVTGSMNETGSPAMSVHFGTAYLFTAVESSRQLEKGFKQFEDVYENGIGFGTQFGKYGTHLELEYMFLNIGEKYNGSYGFDGNEDHEHNFHHRLRLGATAEFVRGIGISAGGTLNMVTEGYSKDGISLKPNGEWHFNKTFKGHEARFWPGFYAGLTLGRF